MRDGTTPAPPVADDRRAQIESVLHRLNYRWNTQTLALWKGAMPPVAAHQVYDGYDDFFRLETLAYLDRFPDTADAVRVKHAFIDHYLQRELLPMELEMQSWIRGAAADVEGEKIYFQDVIPWCQKSSTYEKRQLLQKESSALCKFLKPFVLNYWEQLLTLLREDLGFPDYAAYCRRKKGGIDYEGFYQGLKGFLEETAPLYFSAMERWSRERFNRPLHQLTRFDGMKLLSLEQFDSVYPEPALTEVTDFFHAWDIHLPDLAGLHLELSAETGKSAQALSIFVSVPDEIYVLMRPQGGWNDLETLWHELGHGLSAVFTDPDLSPVERNMATHFSLSEAYAFLLQNIAFSQPFLTRHLEFSLAEASGLIYYKTLRDFSVFRRYATKFLVEYEMFTRGDLSDGQPYADKMLEYTGFYYQPESHLFDLAPEFYCLDYVLGWMGEAVLEADLRRRGGENWMYRRETGEILKKWWHQGNRYDIFRFVDFNGLDNPGFDLLLKKWGKVLNP
ncbi:MAG: hypothetical protein ACOC3A_04135 [Thermodesulfobacteriota bacterium]